tara:strand:- start:1349 stop:1825 length:477 start_codon:yes stop_codon:yes gene_type:complete
MNEYLYAYGPVSDDLWAGFLSAAAREEQCEVVDLEYEGTVHQCVRLTLREMRGGGNTLVLSRDEAGRVLHDRSAFGNGRPFLRPAERYYAKKCGWNWNYGLLMEAVIQGRMDDIYRRGLTWEYFSSLDERDRYYDWMQRGRPACERASHPLNKWLDGI